MTATAARRSPGTVQNEILRAAGRLSGKDLKEFSLSDLVVECWKAAPAVFGLAGYADRHPDNNKVSSSLMGERGLTTRGYLERPRPGIYRLTRAGWSCLRHLDGEFREGETPKKVAAGDVGGRLERLFATEAWQRREPSSRSGVLYAHACAFWNAAAGGYGPCCGDTTDKAAVFFQRLVDEVGRSNLVLSSGREVDERTVGELFDLHVWLLGRFRKHPRLTEEGGDGRAAV
jgi:hypothetical protein